MIFSLGIFAFHYFNLDFVLCRTLLFVGCICYFSTELIFAQSTSRTSICSCVLLINVFLLGATWIGWHKTINEQTVLPADKKLMLYGSVTERIKSNSKLKILVDIVQFHHLETGTTTEINSKVIVLFDQEDTIASRYRKGDFVMIMATMKMPKKRTNPEAFDYAAFLRTKGIFQYAIVKKNEHMLLRHINTNGFTNLTEVVSNHVSSTLFKYLPDTTSLAVASAVLLGNKSLLQDNIYKAYADTGAIHVLSVSGLHVAIFISIFIWLFSLISRDDLYWKLFKILSLVLIVTLYVILTGMSPSVIRAGTMVCLYIVGTNLFKNANAYNILSVAAILMLLYNPYYLFQISFQFSYISLLSILYFQPKIKLLWVPEFRISAFIWDLINVSIAAQILILPFTLFYFHQFPVYFALSGLIAVPLVTLIIYTGTLVVIFEWIINSVNFLLAPLLKFLIVFLNSTIKLISNLPYSKIENIWISDATLFLLIASVLFTILWIEFRNIRHFYIVLLLLLLITIKFQWENILQDNTNQLAIYDVHGGYIMDVIKGKIIHTLMSEGLADDAIQFAVKNNRVKHMYTELISMDPNTHIIQVGKELMYVYNSDRDFTQLKRNLKVKWLFITNTKNNTPEKILDKISADEIILDKNLPPWIENKWLNLHQSKIYKPYSIKKEGAFVVSF